MIGIKKGLLTVKSEIKKDGRIFVVCGCDCGNEKITYKSYFNSSNIRCCGCTLWDYHKPDLSNATLKSLYDINHKSMKQFYGKRIHNTWRSIRFTNKGKNAGSCESWSDFFKFMEDVQYGYNDGLFLQRLDQSKPFSPTNFEWVEKSKIRSRKNTAIIDFNGHSYTVKEFSNLTGLGEGAIKHRIRIGHSPDYIVKMSHEKPKRNRRKVPICQSDLDYQKQRDKASKMVSSYKSSDKKKGLNCGIDIKFMMEEIFGKKCTYCGTYKNVGCDRIDNSIGHTPDNIIPACYTCNTIRRDIFSVDEMKKIGSFISKEIYSARIQSEQK